MATLIIDNVPASLYDRIQDLATTQRRSAADTVLELLESAFRAKRATFAERALPHAPFLTMEIGAPCSIAWPEGNATRSVRVHSPLPTAHDLPNVE